MRIYNLFLLFVIICFNVFPQNLNTKFLYGMYVHTETGIHYNSNYQTYTNFKNSTNKNLMQFWNDPGILGLNTFHITTWLGTGTQFLNNLTAGYGLGSDIYSSSIIPIYQTSSEITPVAEAHYVKYAPDTENTDLIIFNNSIFDIIKNQTYYLISSAAPHNKQIGISPPRIRGEIISDLDSFGGNRFLIRPRGPNTINDSAKFKIVFKYYSDYSDINLSLNLINKSLWPDTTDRNYNLLTNESFSLRLGDDEEEFEFYLDKTLGSAYMCALELNLNCEMPYGRSFRLKSITICDALGKEIVENTNNYFSSNNNMEFFSKLDNMCIQIEQNSSSPKMYPILSLCDEPVVGNFTPMMKTIEYLRLRNANLKLYTTIHLEDSSFLDRAFQQLDLDYIGRDQYEFRQGNTNYRSSVFQYYKKLKDFFDRRNSNNPDFEVISVPQIHTWPMNCPETVNDLREPTEYEILSSAYISTFMGSKGVVYFASGSFWDTDFLNSCKGYGLYNLDFIPYSIRDNSFYAQMFAATSMFTSKKNAIKTFGEFLKKPLPQSEFDCSNHGELLANLDVKSYSLVGTTDGTGIINFKDFYSNEMGVNEKTEITRIELVKENDGTILTTPNMIGVSYLATNDPNISYFVISNLNSTEDDVRLKLFMKSSNNKNFLKVSNLTYPEQFNQRLYSKNGIVLTILPKHSTMILKVQNFSTNEVTDFPREIRFGIMRKIVEEQKTKLILDNNFYSPEQEIEISAAGVGYESFTTDFNEDGGSDIILFTKTVNSTKITLTYKIYFQSSRAVFNNSPTSVIVNIPKPSFNFRIQPMAVGDKLGYVIYNLTSQNCTVYFIDTTNPSDAPIYFSNYYQTYTFQPNTWSNTMRLHLGLWDDYLVPFAYTTKFIIDKNHNGVLENNEAQDFGVVGIPIWGDWYNGDNTEYGIYGHYSYWINANTFLLNWSGVDGFSYFEFPYGIEGDFPIAWKLIPANRLEKSESESLTTLIEPRLTSFPNPFNPMVNILVELPNDAFVEVKIYDLLGAEIKTIVSDQLSRGSYRYNWSGNNTSSGVYFVVSKIDNTILSNKILLLK